ncbi:CDP-alcohol phosphatidyltransferase family protein [Isoptericola hypogeus]|uniref:CDP-alcohol phosphatidyltransferase family protein n=1 Tax=Isoptericola hypogeus TaxID=300179 RepID=A0ABP4VPQ3_9MICO
MTLTERDTYRQTVQRLASAQKGAARSAPAYSRYVNRRLGRLLAAAAFRLGLGPNAVTGISALFTFAGVLALALATPSWALGVVVSLLLVVGYALDSADGQVARLTGTGSSAGEWLDHMVDATKVVSLPVALLVGLYRADAVADSWLLVPLLNAIVSSVLFFGMILTEQLRRAHGVTSRADTGGRAPWLRSVLVVPTDYGVLCLLFLLYGATTVFLWAYAAVTLATAGFLVLAAAKWFREIAAFGRVEDRSAT